MIRILSLSAFAAAILTASPAMAEPVNYEFDKSHTQILFFSDHMGFSTQEGEFHDFNGHFVFDQENPQSSSLEVSIKTASIDMDSERWDAHMKNEDFFNVEVYPEMTFKSTAIEVTGENTANITGDLTLLGQTHPVVLNVTHNKTAPHPMNGQTVSGFTATATLDRTQWGMDYGVPMMDPNIEIRIDTEGSPAAAEEGEESLEN